MFAGEDKIKLGLERLSRAGDDADVLGTALMSLHGALEDRFRQILVSTPGVHESEHARILDVGKVQWNELIDMMRLYQGLTVDDAALVRRMNRERQAVAHGERYRGGHAQLERYARFVLAFFPGIEPPEAAPVPARKARVRKPASVQPAPAPRAARPLQATPARPASSQRAAPDRQGRPAARPRASARSGTPQARAASKAAPDTAGRFNIGMALVGALLLIVACAGLGNVLQGSIRARTQDTQQATMLTVEVGPSTRVAAEALNLRAQPSLASQLLATLPGGAHVELRGDMVRAEERTWAPVRYGAIEGWVDSQFLRQP